MSVDADGRPLLHICHAPGDDAWIHGRMVPELGLRPGQFRTRADDALGALQIVEIDRAVDECRFTILIASTAARWDALAQHAAALAQHAGIESGRPRLIIIARDFSPSEAGPGELSLGHRALVGLDCSDEDRTSAALVRLRALLALDEPTCARPACPYPGLATFTEANRAFLFGRDRDKDVILQRIRAGHTRILVVGPSGCGKSSLIHAAVLPELAAQDHVVRIVRRGGDLVAALRAAINTLEIPAFDATIDQYLADVRTATDPDAVAARARLRSVPVPDTCRRVIVVDPLEEVFAADDAAARTTAFQILTGLWSVPWCTVLLCMRADFYGALMAERCWRELENSQFAVTMLDEAGLRAAILEPAKRVGVHVEAALVERLIRELDCDRSSVPLPLLQVALKELWTHLRWRHLTLADYERIASSDQRGIGAVLAAHAEAVLQALARPADRAVAQRILIDLVHLGEGRPHTRRRRTLAKLQRSADAPDQLERVLEALVAGRLVTCGDSELPVSRVDAQVDLAHDILITAWPVLARWIAEHCDKLRTHRRLEARAASGGPLRSEELPEFIRWIAWADTAAGQALGASNALRAVVRRSVVAQRVRRGAVGVGLALILGAVLVFTIQNQRLRDEQTRAQRSISMAAETATQTVFEINGELQALTCDDTSSVRASILKRSLNLISALSALDRHSEGDPRPVALHSTSADVAFEQGRFAEAQALYLAMLADTQQRGTKASGDVRWKRELKDSYNRLGEIAVSTGKLSEAQDWFEKSLVVTRSLAAAEASTGGQLELVETYVRLGDVAISAGKLADARAWFTKGLAVAKALAADNPGSTEPQRELSSAYGKLGNLEFRAGNPSDARRWLTQGLAISEALVAADPKSTERQRELALACQQLGQVVAVAGDDSAAHAWLARACAAKIASSDAGQSHQRPAPAAIGAVAISTAALGASSPPHDDPAPASALTVTRSEPPRASSGPQGKLTRGDNIDVLIQQLTSSDDDKVRLSAVLNLAKLGNRRAILPFAGVVVEDREAMVRSTAASALGKLVNDQATPDEKQAAIEALTQAKLDSSNFVRIEAEKALQAIEGRESSREVAIYVNVGPMASQTGLASEDARLPSLMKKVTTRAMERLGLTTTWPDGLPSKATLDANHMMGFYVDATVNTLEVKGTGSSMKVSCKISVLVATYPDKSVFGLQAGSAASGANDIAQAEEGCVSAVIEDVIARKIVPMINGKAGR